MNFSKEVLYIYGYHVLAVLIIMLITLLAVKIVHNIMARKKKFVHVDSTQYKFLSHFLSGVIYFFGIVISIYSIPPLRSLGISIFAGSGILAIIIGFASQQAFANIVSGIFIVIFRPFRINDRIRIVGRDFIGFVEDITLRHTVIRTFEYQRIIVPNSVISNEILINDNLIDKKIKKLFEIGISYDSDISRAKQIIYEEALKHPDFLDNRTKKEKAEGLPPVKVKLVSFGDSSINLRTYVWARDPETAFDINCDLNESVKRRFDAEGIEIPFPYRTLVIKNHPQELNVPVNRPVI